VFLTLIKKVVMDEKEEKIRAKRIAKQMAIIIVLINIGIFIYFVTSNKFSIKTAFISVTISTLTCMFFPALMYFWKGPIR